MSKFTVNTKLLARELAYVDSIIDTNPNNPIWQNVLITTQTDKVSILGTDGDSSAQSTFILSKPVTEEVTIALPAKKLLEIVSLIEAETISINEAETRIVITSGSGRYTFSKVNDAALHIKSLLPTAAVPENAFEVGAPQFIDVISTAGKFTASKESTKYTLMAVRFDADEKGIAGFAMDGHRAVDISKLDPCDGRNQTVVIGSSVIKLLSSIVDVSDKVNIIKGESVLVFTSGSRTAVVRRAASENLPDVGQHIDQYVTSNTVKITVDAKPLTNAVKRLQVATDGKLRRINFTAEPALLKMHSVALVDVAIEFDEEVVAETVGTGSCNLNAAFVLDFLKHVDGPVTIHVGESNAPVVISDQTGVRCMFMQLQ